MGAGKSTVGRRLAQLLSLEFVDSDKVIEQRTGASIPLIFEMEGEAGFRRRETEIIDELTQRTGIVVATGGGAILAEYNRECLRRGTVIYLDTSVNQQLQRTRYDKNRPLLQTGNPAARLAELMAIRKPLYHSSADIVVSTDGDSVRSVVRNILRQLKTFD
jgi:shikimate kinase